MAKEQKPLDTTTAFKPWQKTVLKLIDEHAPTENNPIRNRDVWINANKLLPEGESISRTSVIFFLQDLRGEGWLASRQQTGRGGHHDVFWVVCPLDEYVDMKIRSLSGGVD